MSVFSVAIYVCSFSCHAMWYRIKMDFIVYHLHEKNKKSFPVYATIGNFYYFLLCLIKLSWMHGNIKGKKACEAPGLSKITCVSLMRKGLENHWPSPTAQVGLQWEAPQLQPWAAAKPVSNYNTCQCWVGWELIPEGCFSIYKGQNSWSLNRNLISFEFYDA